MADTIVHIRGDSNGTAEVLVPLLYPGIQPELIPGTPLVSTMQAMQLSNPQMT